MSHKVIFGSLDENNGMTWQPVGHYNRIRKQDQQEKEL